MLWLVFDNLTEWFVLKLVAFLINEAFEVPELMIEEEFKSKCEIFFKTKELFLIKRALVKVFVLFFERDIFVKLNNLDEFPVRLTLELFFIEYM